MPNRILRDWTDSDRVNKLTVHEERFFVRLIMKADDYGCYYADTRLLKANLFPLLLDGVREADISRWMAACQKAGLIVLYEASSKKYLQVVDFKQRLDKAKNKFPLPTSGNPISMDNDFPAESEAESDTETEAGERGDAPPPAILEDFKKFQAWINDNANRVSKMKEPFSIEQFIKIKNRYHVTKITGILTSMHNYEPLLKKSRSAYLTALKWLKMDADRSNSTGGKSEQQTGSAPLTTIPNVH